MYKLFLIIILIFVSCGSYPNDYTPEKRDFIHAHMMCGKFIYLYYSENGDLLHEQINPYNPHDQYLVLQMLNKYPGGNQEIINHNESVLKITTINCIGMKND